MALQVSQGCQQSYTDPLDAVEVSGLSFMVGSYQCLHFEADGTSPITKPNVISSCIFIKHHIILL